MLARKSAREAYYETPQGDGVESNTRAGGRICGLMPSSAHLSESGLLLSDRLPDLSRSLSVSLRSKSTSLWGKGSFPMLNSLSRMRVPIERRILTYSPFMARNGSHLDWLTLQPNRRGGTIVRSMRTWEQSFGATCFLDRVRRSTDPTPARRIGAFLVGGHL